MRRFLLSALGLVLAASAAAEPIDLRQRSIDRFDGTAPTGRLAFLGGLVLSGPRGFGGLSALLVEDDRLLAASDTGDWFTARLVMDGERLTGLAETRLFDRRRTDGRAIDTKGDGDAEGLSRKGDDVLVLNEATRSVDGYRADGLAVAADALPRAIALAPGAKRALPRRSVEALATLPNGEVVAFQEVRDQKSAVSRAATLSGRTLSVARNGPWAITGASTLPGGDVIIVERRFESVLDIGMRIRRLGAEAMLRQNATIDGPILIEATLSAEIDNMEAVAAEVRDGRITLTVLSDDNHSFWQRTLLLRFGVTDPLPRPKPLRPA